jgi:hypothetical protein
VRHRGQAGDSRGTKAEKQFISLLYRSKVLWNQWVSVSLPLILASHDKRVLKEEWVIQVKKVPAILSLTCYYYLPLKCGWKINNLCGPIWSNSNNPMEIWRDILFLSDLPVRIQVGKQMTQQFTIYDWRSRGLTC